MIGLTLKNKCFFCATRQPTIFLISFYITHVHIWFYNLRRQDPRSQKWIALYLKADGGTCFLARSGLSSLVEPQLSSARLGSTPTWAPLGTRCGHYRGPRSRPRSQTCFPPTTLSIQVRWARERRNQLTLLALVGVGCCCSCCCLSRGWTRYSCCCRSRGWARARHERGLCSCDVDYYVVLNIRILQF